MHNKKTCRFVPERKNNLTEREVRLKVWRRAVGGDSQRQALMTDASRGLPGKIT